MGVVFPGGKGRQAFARAIVRGESLAKASRLRPEILAAEMEENLKPLVERRGLAVLSRGAILAAAAIEDLAAAEPWLLEEQVRAECALVVGTAFGHIASRAEFHQDARRNGARWVSPILFPNTIINSLAGHAAILFGLSGPNSTVTSGRRSGLEAVIRAATLLTAGRAPRVIVLGCDEVSQTSLRGLDSLREGAWDAPELAIPPGEAAGALLLEAAGPPPARSIGRLLGAAERSSVRKGVSRAVEEAMRAALADAGVTANEITHLSLSGRYGGGIGQAEAEAALAVFGGKTPRMCLQQVLGETFGAQGVLAIAAELAVRNEAASEFSPAAHWPEGPFLVSSAETTGATCAVVSV